MSIATQAGPILSQDLPKALSIDTLIAKLRVTNHPAAQAMADALYEVRVALSYIEQVLREPIPIEGDNIQILDPSGSLGLQLQAQEILLRAQTATAYAVMTLFVNNNGAFQTWTDALGVTRVSVDGQLGRVDVGGEYRVGGTKVVGARQAAVSTVTGTPGATYTATEQTMLANLKNSLNDLIAKLGASGHGLTG